MPSPDAVLREDLVLLSQWLGWLPGETALATAWLLPARSTEVFMSRDFKGSDGFGSRSASLLKVDRQPRIAVQVVSDMLCLVR